MRLGSADAGGESRLGFALLPLRVITSWSLPGKDGIHPAVVFNMIDVAILSGPVRLNVWRNCAVAPSGPAA
jgi:hypothetical protein